MVKNMRPLNHCLSVHTNDDEFLNVDHLPDLPPRSPNPQPAAPRAETSLGDEVKAWTVRMWIGTPSGETFLVEHGPRRHIHPSTLSLARVVWGWGRAVGRAFCVYYSDHQPTGLGCIRHRRPWVLECSRLRGRLHTQNLVHIRCPYLHTASPRPGGHTCIRCQGPC